MSHEQEYNLLPDESRKDEARMIIPVIEEQVRINKKVVETAKVRVSKVVHENVESFEIPVIEEHVSVERITKNELVDKTPPSIRYEGNVMIISVLKEVAVVEKRIMLVEEVRITKSQTQKTETHTIPLRKEEVDITRTQINHE